MGDAVPRLSVNLNKVALLRNSRRTGVPDVLRFAKLVREAGADGITVHPRPDERHIRRSDVLALSELMLPWRPSFELNIEGYPDERFLELVCAVRPEQCTLVPDPPGAYTSEQGWNLDSEEIARVQSAVEAVRSVGSRPIVFVDPREQVIGRVMETGAEGIEIYTGAYAAAARCGRSRPLLEACARAARSAAAFGLVVNVGHDLNLDNLPALVRALPAMTEASIGHALTADALVMGFSAAVACYRQTLGHSTTVAAVWS